MEYAVRHESNYHYATPVTESYAIVHLQPRTNMRQYCTRYRLEVTPNVPVFSDVDRFGNDVQYFSIVRDHQALQIIARSQVVTLPRGVELPHDVSPDRLAADPRTEQLHDFLHASPFVTIDARLQALAAPHDDLAAYFIAAASLVHRTFAYRPGTTTVLTTTDEVIASRAGVCQDFAHVVIALARARGIPTRYASGYIFSGSDPLLGADASHAWPEAYLPPYGWVGYDPTNGRLVDDAFVLVAAGRDYGDVSPTRGTYRGLNTGTLSVNVALDASSEQ